MEKNYWLDGVMGLVVGDALGMPVQFMDREDIADRSKGPVTGMEGYGTYNMPIGTWSDDSSMALANLCSIVEKGELDPRDIMERFVAWEKNGEYTPHGMSFDQGITCTEAIYRYMRDRDIEHCGKTGEHANGNGALMRILPTCLYYYDKQKKVCTSEDEAVYGIHKIAGLTHNHLRSHMCCVLYYFCMKAILENRETGEERKSLLELLQDGVNKMCEYYRRDLSNLTQMSYLGRLFDLREFQKVPEGEIKSGGYVIETIEAVMWCLINSNSFEECLLKAVNLGDDTDTVGAIAGGLAGIYYGYEAIPEEWLSVIVRREWIEELCEKMGK